MNRYQIVIDAGNGGEDTGNIGNGITEKDLNLEISNYMYQLFSDLGLPVYITRTTDETLSPEQRIQRILNAFGDQSNVIIISNHMNAGGEEGAEVIYALRNNSTLANNVLDALEKAGQIPRKAYQRRLPSDPSKDYYAIHRDTGNTQPIIVEYGFLDNVEDANRLKNNWREYTEAVVDAVYRYIGGSSIIPTGYYQVKSGDSLWSIAQKYNTTVNEIKRINNLTSNSLSVGQLLKLPSEPVEEEGIYIVKSGDSLWSIAQKYNTTVDALMKENNLTNSNLSVGQSLIIPNTEITESEDIYTVKSGDSLWSIAQKYNTTVDEIKRLNNLTSDNLSIGQKLQIQAISQPNVITYTVKPGDNLYVIANRYGITQQELMNYNNLTSNLLNIGQILQIPISQNSIQYTVKSGDSLWNIAKRYNTTVNEIKKKNGLTSNSLQIGQILYI